ncbi:MAG: 50S ribosomal protein L25, partial [Candidatus Moraniibacteriota bacterium]
MTTPKLNVAAREKAGQELAAKRTEGLVPAVMYGNKLKPAMYWVKYLEFEKIYRSAGESTILELALEGGKDLNVLIQDVQRDPLSSRFTHIDFYRVRMDEEIETDVPLEFVGESEAVKAFSGILIKSLDEVKVKCLPKDLPRALTVDISALKTFADVIKVRDIKLPKGVEMLEAIDSTIATVEAPR